MPTVPSSRAVGVTATALLTALSLTACGGQPGSGDGDDAPTSFTVLSANEHASMRTDLDALAAGPCAAQHEALPLEHQTVAQADVVQQITLLAGQGALPVHYIAGTSQVRPDGDLGTAGLVLDYQEALTEVGAWDDVLPAASSTITNVYGHMVSLPYQYNLEGIWYNKQLFAEHGIAEPQTFGELMAAADTLQAAGVIPFTAGGSDGWPLTRWIGMHIVREVGPQALTDIRDGRARLTDPAYVAGARALAEMAEKEYFGEGVVSRGGDQSANLFLTGEAAMTYNGSWMLNDINDPATNQIGPENVGLMPFPAVEGGAGSRDHWAANAGTAYAMLPDRYSPEVGDWLACIAGNWGSQALSSGSLSGFRVNEEVADVPAPTAMVQEQIEQIDQTVLWFEALFDAESNSLASTNVSLLVSGQMSPEDYMADLQESIDSNAR
ncbi:ABC transporter substrate-binding protein [Desertihabitans aurantiacus]|uniref:ABC transporter substrate-binding protein n=1 Tax=Desertihabitans aurantiacus TaxID=2282477 RepID=UPI000DF78E33|nr:extracellular solute-binding protein [Desertihabitans aurantiacus]